MEIIDLEQRRYQGKPIKEVLKNNESRIFGITSVTHTRFEAVKVAEYVKKLYPKSLVVVGGVHFMHCAEDTLRRVPEVDIVVRGEGEITIVEIINNVDEGKDLRQVKGITYREDNRITNNPDQPIFDDLDSLQPYTKFSWDEYPEHIFGYLEPIRAISVMSSRGCPYKCIFCSKAGMKYRTRKAKDVVNEIESYRDKFNIEGINFLDLTFTANPHHVRAMCQELIGRNLKLKWWCESRVNIPLELLELMKKAGCVSIAIGVESGSPRILSRIGKGISVSQILSFCKECHDIDIIVQPYFMFSFPGEDEQDLIETSNLIDRIERTYGFICPIQPTMIFPGTELEAIARKQGTLPHDFSWYDRVEYKLNAKLNQLSNIPLYIDKLLPATMQSFIVDRKVSLIATFAGSHSKVAIVQGLQRLAKGDFSLLKFMFFPKFYYKYIRAKLKNIK